jgi:hypothetical protein
LALHPSKHQEFFGHTKIVYLYYMGRKL